MDHKAPANERSIVTTRLTTAISEQFSNSAMALTTIQHKYSVVMAFEYRACKLSVNKHALSFILCAVK